MGAENKMKGQTNKAVIQNKLQRRLRKAMTDAERCLWQELRNRQMDGYKFRRQHPFDDFILDFVCLDKMIVIELDGGQHMENEVAAADTARTKKLENAGFSVLRFWNNEVLTQLDAVKEKIWLKMQEKSAHPHLSPLPEGEEI